MLAISPSRGLRVLILLLGRWRQGCPSLIHPKLCYNTPDISALVDLECVGFTVVVHIQPNIVGYVGLFSDTEHA